MKFDINTILQELKKLKEKPTSELTFDWAIINAWANRLNKSKSKTEPDFIKKKFGSIDNFIKYTTAVYTELKRRNIDVKIKDSLKDYININENSFFTVIDLYDAANKMKTQALNKYIEENVQEKIQENANEQTPDLPELPNYILKRNFIRLVGSTVNGKDTEDSDVDIFIDMPADEIPTWIHKKLHLMLSKQFDKPVQIIYQDPDINGPTEDAIVLYDLVLIKRHEYEPAYVNDLKIELSKIKNKPTPAFKTIYGLDNVSKKDIPFDNYINQPKYNGMQVIITDGGVSVYSKNNNKLSIDLSHIFTEKTPYVFAGEIWSDVLPRQTAIGKVLSGDLNKELNITIYDIIYNNEPYRTNLQLIEKYVKPEYVVKNFDNLTDAISYVKDHPEYDGIIIKDLDATSWYSKRMIKVKKEADIDVQVIRRFKNKNGTFKYEVGYLDGKDLISMGETFSTNYNFEPGNIIEISCGEINQYDSNVIKGYAMRVKGVSTNKKPYSKTQILKIAKSSGLLNYIIDE